MRRYGIHLILNIHLYHRFDLQAHSAKAACVGIKQSERRMRLVQRRLSLKVMETSLDLVVKQAAVVFMDLNSLDFFVSAAES